MRISIALIGLSVAVAVVLTPCSGAGHQGSEGRSAPPSEVQAALENIKHYHKVTDEVGPDWDLSGTVEDLKLLLTVGYRVAQADHFPEWKPGAEFKRQQEHRPKRSQR